MNVRLRMYQVLLFKFGRYLCKGYMGYPMTRFHCVFFGGTFCKALHTMLTGDSVRFQSDFQLSVESN